MAHNDVAVGDGTAFDEYAALLLKLHHLIRNDCDESPEGDDLRDRMDDPWERLSDDELRRVRGLGADLNSMLPDSPFHHPANGGIQCRDVAQAIKAARQAGDYEGVLGVLRERPESVSADRAAFLRGWCYERLGEPEVAALFFEHAAMLDRTNDLYAVFVSSPSPYTTIDASAV